MCSLAPAARAVQQAIANGSVAKTLSPSQRLTIGVKALAGSLPVTHLADEFSVSRKFVYRQAAATRSALDDAFAPSATADERVLFYLPVTKDWLRQAALSLTLSCHASCQGVAQFFHDVLTVSLRVGTVHNIVRSAIPKARAYNRTPNLAKVTVAGLDEIYQNRQPVLVGADIASTYCFLLSREDHCDGDTWGIRLLEAQERGLAPQAFVADFGTAIHAGLTLAMPKVPLRGDVFHALAESTAVVTCLDNRAYQAIATLDKLQKKKTKARQQARCAAIQRAANLKVVMAEKAEAEAVALADAVTLLKRWLHYDVFAVSALPYQDRCMLFDFILAELQARAPLYPSQLDPICKLLQNHREQLLAFAAQLDHDLAQLAVQFKVSLTVVRELFDLQRLDDYHSKRCQKEAALRQQLGNRFYSLLQAVRELAKQVVRASSVIENINSRLRNYFFLRREIGPDYLDLLQFYLNHRRFPRSRRPERVGKSPAELLTGQTHPHWLEMLGYSRFSRN